MSVPTVALSEATPAGGDKIREGDNRIREFKTQVREIVDVDHKYDSSGQDNDMGKHNKVSFIEAADIGTGAESLPILGAQTVGGKAELVFTDEDDNDVQITSGGAMLGVPAGCIVLWSGTVAAIPTGWVICDGNNSTPNLTDRFVIHADGDGAGTRDVGDTGGANTHTLSIAEMPLHGHPYRTSNTGASDATGGLTMDLDNTRTNNAAYTGTPSDASTQQIGGTGGGGAHQNMPKYYALAYIMKT